MNQQLLTSLALLATLLVAVTMPGCGDDDTSSSGGSVLTEDDAGMTSSGGEDASAGEDSSGAAMDSGEVVDTGESPDTAQPMDTTEPPDTAMADTATPMDTTEPPPDTSAPADTGSPDTSMPMDTQVEEDTAPPEACATTCVARADDSQGFCTMEGYFTVEVCEAFCGGQGAGWGDREWEAFTTCTETDPLCFQTIDQCMINILYEGVPFDSPVDLAARIRGSGFDELDGRFAFGQFQYGFSQTTQSDQARVRDGAFAMDWDFSAPLEFGSATVRVALYVDANENITCDPDGDLTFGSEARPRFGTDPLEMWLELDPSQARGDFQAEAVCDDF